MNKRILESAKEAFDRLYNYGEHKLTFTKGYKEYEYLYTLYKRDLEEMGYERVEEKELGYTMVTIRKKGINEL